MTTNEAEHIAQVAALPEEDAAPLLPGPTVSPLQVELGQQYDEFADFSTRLRQEAGKQWRLAGPLVLQSVVAFSTNIVSTVFVGHLGEFELSVVVLSNSVFTVSGLTLMIGLASGMETLCGQAFGAKSYAALGVCLQRAVLICATALALVLLLYTQLQPILLALGQDPEIAAASAAYTLLTFPALMAVGLAECFKRYLMSQGIVTPMAVVSFISTGLSPFCYWACIYGFGWGLTGAAVALAFVDGSNAVLLFCYILYLHRKQAGTKEQTWDGWTWQALRGWGVFLRIALPSWLMLCLEWWAFEATIIMSGLLPNPQQNLSAMGIMLTIISFSYAFPYGLSGTPPPLYSASSTRVSNALGSGDYRTAKFAAAVSMGLVVIIAGVMGTTMFTGRNFWGFLITSEVEVVQLTAQVFPFVAVCTLGDGINAVAAGAVRGCGRQAYAALLNVFTFWVLGVPFAALLAFRVGMGIRGLWLGLMCTTLLQALCISTLLCCLDWPNEAARAASLVEAEVVVDDLKDAPEDAEV